MLGCGPGRRRPPAARPGHAEGSRASSPQSSLGTARALASRCGWWRWRGAGIGIGMRGKQGALASYLTSCPCLPSLPMA
eukprot:8235891-Pyramimonas_sp.AAC.1